VGGGGGGGGGGRGKNENQMKTTTKLGFKSPIHSLRERLHNPG